MADTKVSALGAITISGDDLLLFVNDPGGTPASGQNTVTALAAFLDDLTQTLTNKTIDAASNTVSLTADSVDAITEIAAALKSGADGTLITGTAGTASDLSIWNADGDLVDGPTPPSGTIVGTTDTQTLTNKTIAAGSNTPTGFALQGLQTIWIPANAMTPATTSGPATGQLESTTNKVNVETLDFDATADEFAHFSVAFPKSWNLGTVTFQVWWASSATDADGVAWGLQGVALGDGDPLDTAYGTAVVVTDDNHSAASVVLTTAVSGAVTIANTPADDDLVNFRFFRDVSDANDDMTEDALLYGIKLFFTTDADNDA